MRTSCCLRKRRLTQHLKPQSNGLMSGERFGKRQRLDGSADLGLRCAPGLVTREVVVPQKQKALLAAVRTAQHLRQGFRVLGTGA
eukprot:848080-Pyramimonas_sp.AAC.1